MVETIKIPFRTYEEDSKRNLIATKNELEIFTAVNDLMEKNNASPLEMDFKADSVDRMIRFRYIFYEIEESGVICFRTYHRRRDFLSWLPMHEADIILMGFKTKHHSYKNLVHCIENLRVGKIEQ